MIISIIIFGLITAYFIYNVYKVFTYNRLSNRDKKFLKRINEKVYNLSDSKEMNFMLIFLRDIPAIDKRPYDKIDLKTLITMAPTFYEIPMTDELEQICKEILEYDI